MPANKKNKQSIADDDTSSSTEFDTINSKLDLLINEVSKNNKRLESVESSQTKIEKSIEYLHDEFSEYKQKTRDLEAQLKSMTKVVESFINLENRMDAHEHMERARCLELNGIPYAKNENLMAGLEQIIKHIKISSINLTTDIDKIYRIRQTKRVVVKFIQSTKRDEFFQSYRKNLMNTSQLGFRDTTDRIYVNEVLSFSQSKLYWKAREFKKEHNYKFVWTFRQKIYLRKSSDSDAVVVNDEKDLQTLASI